MSDIFVLKQPNVDPLTRVICTVIGNAVLGGQNGKIIGLKIRYFVFVITISIALCHLWDVKVAITTLKTREG